MILPDNTAHSPRVIPEDVDEVFLRPNILDLLELSEYDIRAMLSPCSFTGNAEIIETATGHPAAIT